MAKAGWRTGEDSDRGTEDEEDDGELCERERARVRRGGGGVRAVDAFVPDDGSLDLLGALLADGLLLLPDTAML
ncbi:hypothetical protein GLOTRDRAFT_100890 [Gloeophyllum trabeum ATCC 11539]|uniref:Uncharacterized protein n=1 Tax=Gloeophyllum trabeum (strain ATCC 11539 / FP-39264 / Madison 617) TaxID=670483 RepID=S7Q178_GLOTA|nr:uncharacterized protein GLOTRDRAFT_100890 [Gloeophyllum trabeum ATCC 11539]EPQ53262.1 hypothetical protein GLOTRDRAFT_100890 [Gloeophyllum trabeum ATCC 11539]